MFLNIRFSLKAAPLSVFTFLFFVLSSVISINAQNLTHTVFPVRLDERYGCVYSNVHPRSHTIYNEPFSVGDPRTPLATFDGGIPVGKNGYSCKDLYGYATMKLPGGLNYNLSNQITITLPTPRNFENIFIEGERGKVLTVTLNGTVSKQITLEPNYTGEPGTYGKYSLFAYEFKQNQTQQISTITVSSSDPYWKFAVYSMGYYVAVTDGNPPDPPGNPNNPIIFVPGIAGSGLSLADTGQRRWLPTLNPCNLYDLTLHDGSSLLCGSYSPQNIKVDDVVRTQTLGGVYNYEVYTTLINRLVNTGGYREYDFNNNPQNRTFAGCQQRHASYPSNLPTPTLFVFAYDWRKSNFENVNALKEYVECVRLFHPEKKVSLVAHSMGGLLSRNYILQNPYNHHIDKLITIGSPFLGTPKGFYSLQTGDFLPFFGDPYTFTMAQVLKDLIEFYPGGHELLTSKAYFDGIYPQTPLSIKYPWSSERPMSYFSTRTWIDNNHPISRPATRGENFHNFLNSQIQSQDVWQNDQTGVEYFHIYGVQKTKKTIKSVRIEAPAKCRIFEIECSSFIRYVPTRTARGDGTVMLESAKRIFDGGKNYNYKSQNSSNPYRFAEISDDELTDPLSDHNGLTKNPKVLDRIIKILQPGYLINENQLTPGDCGNGINPTPCGQINTLANSLGDSEPPSHYVSLHNIGDFRVTSHASDLSEVIGFSSQDGIEKIPIGENSAWLAIPAGGLARKVTFQTIGTPMEIEIIRGVGYDNIEKLTIFKDLDLPANKKIELWIFPGGNISFLYYANGEEQPPTDIFPTLEVAGENAQDINSPVLSYNYQTNGNEKLIDLSATDDLSGVRQIRYSLDGQNFSAYTGSVSVGLSQTKIYAFAEDNNRNRTGIAEFDISGNSYSIGNRVWFDTNNDGKINFDEGFGEEGISSVSLSLFADNDSNGQPDDENNPIASTLTDARGYYSFDNLPNGNYLVRVNPSNFVDGGILKGYRNTTGNILSNTDSDDTHGDENGIEPSGASNIIQTVGILSSTISLNNGVNEPLGETDLTAEDAGKIDGLSNLTIDFGFYQLGFGGTVWNDTGNGNNRNNGILDSDEIGHANFRVRVFNANGTEIPVGADGILGTSDDAIGENNNSDSGGMLTDSAGNYLFKGLENGSYSIKIFRAGMLGSAVFSNNPNDNVDSDNNGMIGNGTGANFIVSSNFTATVNDYGSQGNTLVSNEIGTTQDLTLDFGLVFSPTTAMVSVSGRVLSTNGQGIGNVAVSVTKSNGEIRQTFTNSFGHYHFAELEAGEVYIISVSSRKYIFSINSQIISLYEHTEKVNFIASP